MKVDTHAIAGVYFMLTIPQLGALLNVYSANKVAFFALVQK